MLLEALNIMMSAGGAALVSAGGGAALPGRALPLLQPPRGVVGNQQMQPREREPSFFTDSQQDEHVGQYVGPTLSSRQGWLAGWRGIKNACSRHHKARAATCAPPWKPLERSLRMVCDTLRGVW
jgi:hypothetical protein